MSIYFGADNTVIHSASGLGGMVQVLQTVKTDTFSQVVTAGSLSNVCISRTFTASSTSNKLLLMASLYCNSSDQWTQNGIVFTDNGTGDITVNMTNSLSNTNYVVAVHSSRGTGDDSDC